MNLVIGSDHSGATEYVNAKFTDEARHVRGLNMVRALEHGCWR
jgi:hypothetical protein